ncbi:MAG: outer membrane protein transport protein [Desulfobacter sp.]|nr:outer membrane protein transport protein [Desulfobacter sp.]WDP85090.1 MAG: outer membrane protein transport protein [Desulfobacter sp.]
MKKWFNPVLLVVLILGTAISAVPAFGSGIDNKQSFSAAYAGSLSRNAATDEPDIAAYNPAGMMMLKNGLHFEFNIQPFTFDYEHSYGNETHTASPNLASPTAFAIHKSDNWAFWGAFTVNGGGGEVEYDNGNIITEGIGNMGALGMFTDGFPTSQIPAGAPGLSMPGGTLSNEYAYVESYDYTFTTGVSYKINEMFALAAGVRYVITDKEVDIHGDYTDPVGTMTHVAGKYEQEADGFGGIFGINIHPSDTVNIGIRYETRVNLDWETTVAGESKGTVGESILGVFGRQDGQSYARDLPAVLALGVEWSIMPKLTISPSYTLYFEKDADWGDQNDSVDGNSYDLALSLRYDFSEKWTGTIGYMYTDVDMKPQNFGIIEKMSPPLDCHTLAVGGKYKWNERLAFTLGLAGFFYIDDTAPAVTATPIPGNPTITPEVTYDKVLYQCAVGIRYSFF